MNEREPVRIKVLLMNKYIGKVQLTKLLSNIQKSFVRSELYLRIIGPPLSRGRSQELKDEQLRLCHLHHKE